MSKMKTLSDLLEHELQDLYSAEMQIIEALPKMEKKASDSELKRAFATHLEQTRNQKRRLEEACEILGVSPNGRRCKAIAGIISEAEDFIKEDPETDVMDAGLIANAQKVEHYEIAGYGTVCYYAEILGHQDVASLLKETMSEETEADQKLNTIAKERVNEKAES